MLAKTDLNFCIYTHLDIFEGCVDPYVNRLFSAHTNHDVFSYRISYGIVCFSVDLALIDA